MQIRKLASAVALLRGSLSNPTVGAQGSEDTIVFAFFAVVAG
jgi:hypothetical protein